MKEELSIEEKAERYDKIIERSNELLYTSDKESLLRKTIESILPELKESEDEEVEKAILGMIYDSDDELWDSYGVSKSDVLAWFEKQNEKVEPIESFDTEFEKQISRLIASIINKDYEYTKDFVKWTSDALLNYAKHEIEKPYQQKPTDEEMKETLRTEYEKGRADVIAEMQKLVWSEEDTEISSMLIELVESKEESMEAKVEFITWLRSLKNKILPKPKQEWSEEDEKVLHAIRNALNYEKPRNYLKSRDFEFTDILNWLKSLKERYTWKPSKEQMEFLLKYAEQNNYDGSILTSLYQDLKKLM